MARHRDSAGGTRPGAIAGALTEAFEPRVLPLEPSPAGAEFNGTLGAST